MAGKPDVDNTEEFRCISLCSGYAGIELGLERVIPNFRTVLYVEVEAFACANLVAKIEQGKLAEAPIWTDIKTFDGRPFRNRVHIITGGYPCQPFSVAGQRKGEQDPRHLWPYIERIIKKVEPVWCFFENVSGHLTIGFPSVYRSLRNLGYSVETGLFTATEVGAPHKRERLFILAYSECGVRRGRGAIRQGGDDREGVCVEETKQTRHDLRSETIRCNNGTRTMGNAEHDGYVAESKLRSNEKTSDNGGQKEQAEAGESQGTDRPPDVPGIQGSTGRSEQLADRNKQGLEGGKIAGNTESQRQKSDQQPARHDRWPSRPRQPQYEWEEPRVVENAVSKRGRGKGGNAEHKGRETGKAERKGVQKDSKRKDGIAVSDNQSAGGNGAGKGQTESRLGGAANGTQSRVDRLRLLGNGVVPQCAELAFRTLIRKFD